MGILEIHILDLEDNNISVGTDFSHRHGGQGHLALTLPQVPVLLSLLEFGLHNMHCFCRLQTFALILAGDVAVLKFRFDDGIHVISLQVRWVITINLAWTLRKVKQGDDLGKNLSPA